MQFLEENQSPEEVLRTDKIPDTCIRYKLPLSHATHTSLTLGSVLSQSVKSETFELWKHDLFIHKPGFIFPYTEKFVTLLHFMIQGTVVGWLDTQDCIEMPERQVLLFALPSDHSTKVFVEPGHYISCHINFEPGLLEEIASADDTLFELLKQARQKQKPVAGYYHPAMFDYTEYSILEEICNFSGDAVEHHYLIMSRIYELLRKYNSQLRNLNTVVGIPKNCIRKLHEIKKYILDNLSQPLSIESISHQFAIGSSTLRKHFRQYFKQQLRDFYKEQRMKAALHFLKQGELTISQIAAKIGYQDCSSFTRAFTNYFGRSPNQTRQQSFSETVILQSKP